MKKYPLIGMSIVAVVLLILGSCNNIIGYQAVQASNQKIMNNEVNGKELLFQTIVDIANNKEIQRIMLKSQISNEGFFNPDTKFSFSTPPVLTEKFLKHAYTMGVILSKTISNSKIHSLLEQYPEGNQGLQKEINAVIEKDTKLKGEIGQLSILNCHCGSKIDSTYPKVACAIIRALLIATFLLYVFLGNFYEPLILFFLFQVLVTIGGELFCPWIPPYSNF